MHHEILIVVKKHRPSESAFTSARLISGVLLCLCGVSLATFSVAAKGSRQTSKAIQTIVSPAAPTAPAAATPGSGTLDANTKTLTYTDGPLSPNPTGVLPPPVCGPNDAACSVFTVTINAASLATTHNFTWSVQWPVPNVDMDIFVENPDGSLVANNNSTTDPSAITLPVPPNGTVYRLVVASSVGTSVITGTVTLEPKYPTAQQGAGAPPRYMHYPAGAGQGNGANEPSIGIHWNPNLSSLTHDQVNTGGVAFFTVGSKDYRVNFDDCSSPAVNPWEDVSAPFTITFPLSDPIGFVDHFSTSQLGLGPNPPHTPGRVFSIDLIGGQGDSFGSFSDDDGTNWLNGGNGGAPAGPDHETLGGGPFHAPIPTPPAPAYPNVIYYCSQNGAQNAECSASYDGGVTFGPGVPLFDPTVCGGGIHGHVKVSPQGTAYVPNSSCAAGSPVGANGVARSTDNGLSWHEFNVPNSTGSQDPAIGIGQNNVGKPPGQMANTIYLGWVSADNHAHIAHSPDEGATWQDDIDVSSIFGIQKAVFPIVVAGDDNRAAYAFLGTYPGITTKQVWHLYVATTYDGGHSWILTDTTPDDPVQVGDVCLLGLSCTSANRNLLDFNGIDVDKEGRVLIAYTDGCPNCQNVNSLTQSSSAHAVVARQAGGRRLFAAFDSQPQADGTWPPAAPKVVSAVRQSSPAGVVVTWMTPDNGGSPILGYNIYRGTASGAETLLGSVTGESTNKYLDQTADSSTNYFYRVTAVNAVSEGPFCREVSIDSIIGPGTACVAPYLQVAGAGSPGTVPTDPTSGELTIQHVNMGEPFTNCSDKSLTFVMKVNSLAPAPPPNAEWQVLFNVPDTNGTMRTLFVEAQTQENPAVVSYSWGWRGTSPTGGSLDNGQSTALVTGSTSPDGTITMKFDISNTLHATDLTGNPQFDVNIPVGTTLTSIQGNTYLLVGAEPGGTGGGLIENVSKTSNSGTYTTIGNARGCNTLTPLAILTVTPTSGPTSTNFSFNGTSSFEPNGACGSINSYTLDFGDGSPAQTNGNGLFSHTYSAPGNYPARLTVTDSIGHVSTNIAQVVVNVTSGQIGLSGVVSRKQHGLNNPQDLALSLGNIPSIEPRAAGGTGVTGADYQLIFAFPNTLTSVGGISASATGATQPGTPSGAMGSDPHQYVVNLPSVPTSQYLTVTLTNVHDSTGLSGNVSVKVGILPGDVDGTGRVDGNDVSATQSRTRQNVTSSNFKWDVDASGRIDGNDVSLVQSQTRKSLPPLQ